MQLENDFIILGLDNSLHCTGWSVVQVINYNKSNQKLKLLDYGYIDTNGLENPKALVRIYNKIDAVFKTYFPQYISAEAPFVGKNNDTIQKLSQVHGITLLLAGIYDIPVRYYSVMTLKSKTLGGIKTKREDGTKKTGDEMKEEVKRKVIEIFGVKNFIKDYTNDVTDSLSAIVTFLKMNGEEVEKKSKSKKKKNTSKNKDELKNKKSLNKKSLNKNSLNKK